MHVLTLEQLGAILDGLGVANRSALDSDCHLVDDLGLDSLDLLELRVALAEAGYVMNDDPALGRLTVGYVLQSCARDAVEGAVQTPRL